MTNDPFAAFAAAIAAAPTKPDRKQPKIDADAEARMASARAEAEARQAPVEAERARLRAIEADNRLHEFFVDGFINAVLKTAATHNWTAGTLADVQKYCMALVTRTDAVIPPIDPKIGEVVRSKLAYGVLLQREHGQKIPDGWVNGMRQDWFAPLFDEKSGATKANRIVIAPGPRPTRPTVYSSQTPAPKVDPPDAITRKGTPGGRPGGRQLAST